MYAPLPTPALSEQSLKGPGALRCLHITFSLSVFCSRNISLFQKSMNRPEKYVCKLERFGEQDAYDYIEAIFPDQMLFQAFYAWIHQEFKKNPSVVSEFWKRQLSHCVRVTIINNYPGVQELIETCNKTFGPIHWNRLKVKRSNLPLCQMESSYVPYWHNKPVVEYEHFIGTQALTSH